MNMAKTYMQAKEFDIAGYKQLMARYLAEAPAARAQVFWEALAFAERAHAGQFRRSGDAYILHPCQVARILAEELDIRDPEILAGALLHDTIEDVIGVTVDGIAAMFGDNVAAIVDGCTKIIQYSGDKQNFYKLVHRKIFSGAAARLEVMLIKMADRLHNLRTLDAMPRDRRQKVADETLDIYAPMAKVMGCYNLKRELYDLALKFKFPSQSKKVLAHIRQLLIAPEVEEILKKLREEMKRAWIDCEITPGAKGLWGYFDPVNKVLAKSIDHPLQFVIEIDDVHSCYRALGVVNQNFPPIPRTIRDFIANPKPTGYQGLHARANIKGQNYLFKIRTPEMARNAQKGIIRGWSGQGKVTKQFEQELREMFDLLASDEALSAREVIAAGGKKEIYTYSPKGDRICLPKQSIVLDFAYRVHTEVGDHCIAALVGGQRVGPEHMLQDGDRVKIIRQQKDVLFDPHLLEMCQTAKARSGLSRGFRLRRQTLAAAIGESIVRQELQRHGIPGAVLEKKETTALARHFGKASLTELFAGVGEGAVNLKELVCEANLRLFDGQSDLQPASEAMSHITLTTTDSASIKFSACCKPVPTESHLIGLLNDWGVSVHRRDCSRFQRLKIQREDAVEINWHLRETAVTKPQALYVAAASRNRLLMLLAVAPDAMRVKEVIVLSAIETKRPAWEISFEIADLYGLQKVLQHFTKSGLEFEFVLDQ